MEGTTVRRYEMRDLAAAPRFANPDLGLGNPALVSTRPATCDLTVLDTSDRRLLRNGIVLAHRSMDGEGSWLLAAPSWAPQLPAEYVEPMTDGEIPERIRALLAPLLRHSDLAPVGTQHRARTTYLLRASDREPLGSVIDDHVTVRREGQVLTQYREVSIDTGSLSEEQVAWLDQVLRDAEGLRVEQHRSLPARFRILIQDADGAPAGSLAGAEDEHTDPDASMAEIVGRFVLQGARDVLRHDFDIRSGRTRKVQPLVRALRTYASELPAIAPVLTEGLADGLAAELTWAADELDGAFGADQQAVLNGERYLDIYRHISVLRSAPLAEGLGAGSARAEVGAMVATATDALLRAGRAAPHTLDDSGWHVAASAAERLVVTADLAMLLAPKQAKKLRGRAQELYDGLVSCDNEELESLRAALDGSTPEEAFGIGRRYAGLADTRAEARAEFTEHWPKDSRKLHKAARELLERLGVREDGSEPALTEQALTEQALTEPAPDEPGPDEPGPDRPAPGESGPNEPDPSTGEAVEEHATEGNRVDG